MPVLNTIGLEAPFGFPAAEHDALNKRVSEAARPASDEWHVFASAWNTVALRSIAAERESRRYIDSVRKHGSSPVPSARFDQDDALFAFCFYSLSAIETFYMAAYAVGTLVNASAFPMNNKDDIFLYPRDVRAKFATALPAEAVTGAMGGVLSNANFQKLSVLRNIMSHRGTPPRTHYNDALASTIASNPKDLPTNWVYSTPINDALVHDLNTWRRGVIDELTKALHRLGSSRLTPRP